MALKRLVPGALNALSDIYKQAVDLVVNATTGEGKLPDPARNEWITGGHARSTPQDLLLGLGTSNSPAFLEPEDLSPLLGVLGHRRYQEDLGFTGPRRPGEEYLTVHSHPHGLPFPSAADLLFQNALPDPTSAYLGVVGTSTQKSRDPYDLVSGLTATRQLVPQNDPLVGRAHEYIDKWYRTYKNALDDQYMMDWAAAQAPRYMRTLEAAHILDNDYPRDVRGADEAREMFLRQEKKDVLMNIIRRYAGAAPIMRLADDDIYDVHFSQSNLPGPLYLENPSQDDLLEDYYTQLMRRGHLNYAEGGSV